MTAGREATPKDAASTEHLMFYWSHGEGAKKINWGAPGDHTRCVLELGKYVSPNIVHGLCTNLEQRARGSAGHGMGDKGGYRP